MLLTQVRSGGILLLLTFTQLKAQTAATVPASSDVYRRIEAVSAFFPVPAHLGLRPASQRAILGVVDRLEAAASAAPTVHPRRQWALRELAVLRESLARDSSPSPPVRTRWRADLQATNARTVRIDSNGLGTLDAAENAFAPGRWGQPMQRGGRLTAFPAVALAGRHAAIVAQPVIRLGAGAERSLEFYTIYGRAVIRGLAVQLGSDERFWGQSPRGALFLSGHAAPLPALSVSTDAPVTLPWLFGLAGPLHATLMVADLGPSQVPRRARLAGWQVSMHPWSRFELGVAVLAHTGGSGGPPATFLERVVDLIPVIDALHPRAADLQISNKIAGGNLRLRFPELSGLDVYYELAIDDFDGRRLVSSLVDDSGHLLGFRVAAGEVVWRAEWHRTSLRLYEHAQFRSGVTYRQRIIGNPLGHNAKAGYLTAEMPLRGGRQVRMTVGDERRDPSQYMVSTTGPRDRGWRFVRISDDPLVRRASVVASLDQRLARDGGLEVTAGYNRAWREGGRARHELVAQLSIRSRFLAGF